MSLSIGVHHLAAGDLPVFHIIEFELLRMSKMLKYHPILICNRNSHLYSFLSSYLLRNMRSAAYLMIEFGSSFEMNE